MLKTATLTLAAAATLFATAASATNQPPRCQPSVGTTHRFVCTTDFTTGQGSQNGGMATIQIRR